VRVKKVGQQGHCAVASVGPRSRTAPTPPVLDPPAALVPPASRAPAASGRVLATEALRRLPRRVRPRLAVAG
jgi:hypothetical protein